MTTDELMAQVCPLIGDNGWAYYFTPETRARGKELGLDLFGFYFLGRGGVLGDVEAEVVVSAFGYFNPEVVHTMWDSAKLVLAPREAARAHFACAADHGRSRLAGVEGLEEFCHAAGAVNDAADYVGMALYAGFRAEPLVDDAAGRAMQLTAVLREFRGGAHLVAVRASGLGARTAHYASSPDQHTVFGWAEDDEPVIGTDEREAMAAAESLTDDLVRPAYAVLTPSEAEALLAGIRRIATALAAPGPGAA